MERPVPFSPAFVLEITFSISICIEHSILFPFVFTFELAVLFPPSADVHVSF